MVIACGDDDDSGGNTADGGTAPVDLSELNNRLDSVENDVADLQDGLDGVQKDVGDANDKIDGVSSDLDSQSSNLDSRLTDLETVPKCSANEDCIPDGIEVAQMGIEGIVAQLCELEINCCSDDELNYKFGPGITTVDECTKTFTELVNNGLSPDFLSTNGVLINRVINIAQAINSNDVQVEVDADAVTACVDSLKDRECNKYQAPEVISAERCEPVAAEDVDDPCALSVLVKGLQQEGEVCGVSGLNECAPGLACREAQGSALGICAMASEVDDPCRRDADCDGTDQFCNLTTGLCQLRGDEGDDCAYVDPSFTSVGGNLNPNFVSGLLQNPGAVKIECKRGLMCDPTTDTCVKNCSAGALCSANSQCPDGMICDFTTVEKLNTTFALGICGDPIAKGDPCTEDSECATERCALDVIDERTECTDPLKAIGDDCTLASAGLNQSDITCESGYCAGDAKCASLCTIHADCPSTHYCSSTFDGRCLLRKPNGESCSPSSLMPGNPNDNFECQSGFCSSTTQQCEDKVAQDAACPTQQASACPSTQYCSFDSNSSTYLCTDFVAVGGSCAGGLSCTVGSYCAAGAGNANTCVAYAAAEDTCDVTADIRCAPGLSCAELGTTDKCYDAGTFPIGADCTGCKVDSHNLTQCTDALCDSGWCRGSDSTCQAPIAEGGDCDADDSALNRCEQGTYCMYPNLPTSDADYGKGTCTAKSTVGMPCEPRFNNQDCLSGCVLRNDQFVCDTGSIVEETLFCDGE